MRSLCQKAKLSRVESVAKATNSESFKSSFRTLVQDVSAIFAARVLIETQMFITAVVRQTTSVGTIVVQSVLTMLQRRGRKKSLWSNTYMKILN